MNLLVLVCVIYPSKILSHNFQFSRDHSFFGTDKIDILKTKWKLKYVRENMVDEYVQTPWPLETRNQYHSFKRIIF